MGDEVAQKIDCIFVKLMLDLVPGEGESDSVRSVKTHKEQSEGSWVHCDWDYRAVRYWWWRHGCYVTLV